MADKYTVTVGDYSATDQSSDYVNPVGPVCPCKPSLPPDYAPPPPLQAFVHPEPARVQSAPDSVRSQIFTVTTTAVPNPSVMNAGPQTDSDRAKQLAVGGAILACIIGVLLVVGISTNQWAQFDTDVFGNKVVTTYGLWQACDQSTCRPTSDFGGVSGMQPIQGFAAVGTVLVIAGVVLHCVMAFTHARNKTSIAIAAIVLYGVAIFCVVIALVMFAVSTLNLRSLVKSWSFYLTTITPIGCIVLAVLAGMARQEYAARGAVSQSQPVTVTTIA